MFEELLSLWQPHRGLVGPPPSRIQLWSEGGRGVWVSESWGPAVPYGPIDHEDGNQNHGYMRINGDAIGAQRIPEAMGWPELAQFLDSLNTDASPIESVGCGKSFFPVTDQGDITVSLGAYIDVIFTDPVLNERPREHSAARQSPPAGGRGMREMVGQRVDGFAAHAVDSTRLSRGD